MKICILSSFEDSMQKDTGASVRIYNLAKGLAERGNDVKVVMPRHTSTLESVDGITTYSIRGLYPRVLLILLTKFVNVGRPTSLYFYDLLFIHRVIPLLRDADIIQIEQQSSGGFLIPLIKWVLKRPIVIDCHDVFQALRLQHTSILRRMLETFLERMAYANASLILVVSKIEKSFLTSMGYRKCRLEVIPNGVDSTSFTKLPVSDEVREKYAPSDSKIVVFVGNLNYPPNREAIELLSSTIAPRVHNKIENVKFLVIGKLSNKVNLPGLTFVGFVENLPVILSVADVAVAPLLQGSGTRLKIIEYFSCSLPVVSTSIGAEGLDTKNGVNIFIENDLEAFALRIVELLENKNLSFTAGNHARMLVEGTYDWRNIAKSLERNLSLINTPYGRID